MLIDTLITHVGVKAWRRARFANTVRLLTDLDEDGLKYVLKNLPAWVKVCGLLMLNEPMLLACPCRISLSSCTHRRCEMY